MTVFKIFVFLFVIRQAVRWGLRLRRAQGAFGAKVQASKLHLMDPSDQMKVFLTPQHLVTPSRAFDEAYRSDESEADAAKADEIIARALQEKAAPPVVIAAAPAPEARSFGRRRSA